MADHKTCIAALGNPGPEYRDTRHNLGFMLADRLLALGAERPAMRLARLPFSDDCELYALRLAGASRLLAKPLTYMNLSGQAVARVVGRNGLTPADVVVVHDDLDLPLGRIKLKRGGSSGGHKGVESIAQCLGSPEFWRLRLGIGRPPRHTAVERFVLEPFAPEEQPAVRAMLETAHKGLELMLRRGPQAAMMLLHTATPPEAAPDTARTAGSAPPCPPQPPPGA
ncbi:MAG: aminoacyl-tRNA hydrolase, partial [Desulfovibrionaceae bacterium]